MASDRLRLVDNAPAAIHRDARRYAYEAEMRRFSLASSLTAAMSTRENDNAFSSIIRHDFGPRLGLWGDLSRERG
jgi:hypothetical protein